MHDLGTVLGIWAHPDDDIYLSSGLMAVAAKAGNRVVDVTATRGEGGSMDEERWPPDRMAEVRAAEMRRSLEILGVGEHRFLDGPVDVDMQTPLDASGLTQVIEIVREVQPDTILTFGPDGMTGHEGHKSVSGWAREAFEECAKPGAALYHAAVTPAWAETWLPLLEPFGIFLPGTPPIVPPERMAIAFALPEEVLDLKFRAIQAHESQVEGLIGVFGDRMRDWMAVEYFCLAGEQTA
jgi:LmbE family N-acetylglucosaminyl deacetylase